MATTTLTTAQAAAQATADESTALLSAVANAASISTNAAVNASNPNVTVNGTSVSTAAIPGAVSTLVNNITNYQYNPALIQKSIMQTLADVTNGNISIVDPSNPFVFCLEAAAVSTAAFMMKNETNTRKQYPFSAQTQEDLYLHMSDVDYINRFASPSTTTFSLLLPLTEVLNKMVLDPNTGIKQLVIPRNTYFTVANVPFSIQYPIVIQQMQHGGLQIIYDTSILSPLQQLTSNIIKYEIRSNSEGDFIYFEFEVMQFDIISQVGSINAATDFSIGIDFNDQYYYTRAYVENPDGTWTEIATTHSAEIYDINNPTAVLQVINNTTTNGTSTIPFGGTVNISIPQIYTGTGVLNSGVRFDVYETKGPLNMILWEYPFTAFTATWLAIDPNDQTPFVAPLNTFNSIIPFSSNVVSGGTNGVPFSQLQKQVMTNSLGELSLPITNSQISTALEIDGYTIVTNVDNITNRVFLATKSLPLPTDASLLTPAASSIITLFTSIESLLTKATVIDNTGVQAAPSITITPDTIYKNTNGVVSIVTDIELATLLQMNNANIATNVNNNNYLYTPFHYVLDLSNNEFNVRPYYLDNPTIVTQLFVETNATTLLEVNTGTYSIYRTATGYTITVVTVSNVAYKAIPTANLAAQLSFIPNGQSTPAYLMATFMGSTTDGEAIFSFDISTNFNVDINDFIQLTKFQLFGNQPILTGANLLTNFDIIYITSLNPGPQYQTSAIDSELFTYLVPSTSIGITHEILRVKFGYSLDRLWARSRSVISASTYQTYPLNVPRTYENDVYETDVNGSTLQFDSSGKVLMNLLYKKGDPVLLNDGTPVYLHLAGDTVLDSNGNPIVINTRGITRQIDLMLIEGAYWFANDVTASNYRTLMTQSILSWLINDLVNIESNLLEQTDIYFYPNATLGTLSAKVDNGLVTNIDASQSFTVNLYVSQVVYSDSALRTQLTTSTIATIAKQLTQSTFSIDSITSALRSIYGTDVISMNVSGIGGTNNYSVVTILDNSKNCSIKKVLTAMPDNTLVVVEDVTVNYILYQVSNN